MISAAGWQDACSVFHRSHPLSRERCEASNRELAAGLGTSGCIGRKCDNGLMDYATPIVVEGKQLATLYYGQLLHEPPDMELFRRQAQECGFDEGPYLAAIEKLPVMSEARVQAIMDFYVRLAQMLAQAGLDRLRHKEVQSELALLNQDLTKRVDERTAQLKARQAELMAESAERQRAVEALHASQTQLQAVLDSSPVGIGWSVGDKVEYVNRKFIEMFGYILDDIPTIDDWYRLAYPDTDYFQNVVSPWIEASLAARTEGRDAPSLESHVRCKDGRDIHVLVSLSWTNERRLVNFVDITDRWRAEQREQFRTAILEVIAQGAPLSQTLKTLALAVEADDPETRCSILLLDESGRHLLIGAAPSLPDFFTDAIDGLEIGPDSGSCGVVAFTRQRMIVADIRSHPCWTPYKALAQRAGLAACCSDPIFSAKGKLLGTVAIYYRTATAPTEANLRLLSQAANLASIAIDRHYGQIELERQARTDFLTGLANRRHFMEQASHDLARAKRYAQPLSLLMVDVDHFKNVNDTYGHKSGDLILQHIADIMRETMREVDLVSRMGGEEFAVALPNTTEEEALHAAERLLHAVADTEIQGDGGVALHITVSIGVATLADKQNDVGQLLKRADLALYAAKNSGRNRVCAANDSSVAVQQG